MVYSGIAAQVTRFVLIKRNKKRQEEYDDPTYGEVFTDKTNHRKTRVSGIRCNIVNVLCLCSIKDTSRHPWAAPTFRMNISQPYAMDKSSARDMHLIVMCVVSRRENLP
jgi:hypothetical protein